jgi:hypothetical protein
MGFWRRVLTAFWWTTAALSAEGSPSNRWKLIHEEDASGGKRFAKAIYAESVGQVYLWGTGGKRPARNVYERFELERFDPANADGGWSAALPAAARGKWSAQDFPPFRIYGQSGPDGLKYDEGPRPRAVSLSVAAPVVAGAPVCCGAPPWPFFPVPPTSTLPAQPRLSAGR